jgi:hypothetical protein
LHITYVGLKEKARARQLKGEEVPTNIKLPNLEEILKMRQMPNTNRGGGKDYKWRGGGNNYEWRDGGDEYKQRAGGRANGGREFCICC